MQDLSLISIDDVFKKKVVLEYVYGRLSAILTKLQRLPNNIPGQMFLIRPQPEDFVVDSETFLNTRLGVHGQNFIKDMTGLSVLILLEFAEIYPQTKTLTTITRSLNKPKTTIKSHLDKLIELGYIVAQTIVDTEHIDRRYKDLSITEYGIHFLSTLQQEIESTLTAG